MAGSEQAGLHSNKAAAPPLQGPLVLASVAGTAGEALTNKLLHEHPAKFGTAIRHSNRKPEKGEQEGMNAYFVKKEVLQKMIDAGQMAEWQEIAGGNLAGTAFASIQQVQCFSIMSLSLVPIKLLCNSLPGEHNLHMHLDLAGKLLVTTVATTSINPVLNVVAVTATNCTTSIITTLQQLTTAAVAVTSAVCIRMFSKVSCHLCKANHASAVVNPFSLVCWTKCLECSLAIHSSCAYVAYLFCILAAPSATLHKTCRFR